MTDEGAEIAKLQSLLAKLKKTAAREATLADRNRALVKQHENRFTRTMELVDKTDAKLTGLLDEKLAKLNGIQTESGEWEKDNAG